MTNIQEIPELITGSDCSGVGALDQALAALGVKQKKLFACDMDKFSRQTYIENYGTEEDKFLLKSSEVIFIDNVYYREYNSKYNKPTQEEWDIVKATEEDVARKFSFYFPWNMYSREIPTTPLDWYGSTVPCQAFSMAGKRKGEEDKRGILFYNSHDFIRINKPRGFFFENVKGLVSDDKVNPKDPMGRTFRRWLDLLGGKSVNGNEVIFPHEDSVPYHIYWSVLNAKDYGIPQNRERIFIIGIRDDEDNGYKFPKPVDLKKRLRDMLEENVDEKYFLSQEMLDGFLAHSDRHAKQGNGFKFTIKGKDDIASCIMARVFKMGTQDNYIQDIPKIIEAKAGRIIGRNPENPKSRKSGEKTEQMLEINENPDVTNTLTTVEKDNVILVKSNTKKGYEEAEIGDSINISQLSSKTRRGRAEDGLANTLETISNQAVVVPNESTKDSDTLQYVGAVGEKTIMKGKGVSSGNVPEGNRVYSENGISRTITSQGGGLAGSSGLYLTNYRIRRLTPRECFNLMGFPQSFTWPVSDSQAYKQSGNSIVMHVLKAVIQRVPFIKHYRHHG